MKLSKKELKALDGYFRCANYLSVGQLYLVNNPLLEEPLEWQDVKKKIVGHWGTVPGQNFIYAHLNRIIKTILKDKILLKNINYNLLFTSKSIYNYIED